MITLYKPKDDELRFNAYHDSITRSMLNFDAPEQHGGGIKPYPGDSPYCTIGRFAHLKSQGRLVNHEAESELQANTPVIDRHEMHKAYIAQQMLDNKRESMDDIISKNIYPIIEDDGWPGLLAEKAAIHSGEIANLNYDDYTDEEIAR